MASAAAVYTKYLTFGYVRESQQQMRCQFIPLELFEVVTEFYGLYDMIDADNIGAHHSLTKQRILVHSSELWAYCTSLFCKPVSHGYHSWTFQVLKITESIKFGICHADQFVTGDDWDEWSNMSYGVDIHENPQYQCENNDIVSMHLDLIHNKLLFSVNGEKKPRTRMAIDPSTYKAAVCTFEQYNKIKFMEYRELSSIKDFASLEQDHQDSMWDLATDDEDSD